MEKMHRISNMKNFQSFKNAICKIMHKIRIILIVKKKIDFEIY